MKYYFTNQRNIQIVLSLLKANGIKRIITSPGATDIPINFSLQHDSFFELYSCVDERSAAYMACGMAAETKEPVALTCTGATSSRNYMPGLTEAFYRHLPVLAITCSQPSSRIGHYFNQVTDRNHVPNDIVEESVCAQIVKDEEDEWDVTIKVNRAILGLKRNGGGPCHINLEIGGNSNYFCKEIVPARKIDRITSIDTFPNVPQGRIAIFVGQHPVWDEVLKDAVESFCEKHNAFVLCDQTSNYKGRYAVLYPLIIDQAEEMYKFNEPDLNLIIHIGFVSNITAKAKQVWRVNEDGEIRDTFKHLTKVFQMSEKEFFLYYVNKDTFSVQTSLYEEYEQKYQSLLNKIPELPFSNLWMAQHISANLPENSVLHLGIRNSLRSYEYFKIPDSVVVFSNTGGFGIDGGMSSLIGASIASPDKLFFGVFGDLLFFYDINSLGNRDIKNNVRILLVNNGLGQEFKNYSCLSASFGEETDSFIAAKGHFGCQSRQLVKGYTETLGFEYMSASNKEEFKAVINRFLSSEHSEKPMVLEVFTNTDEENEALKRVTMITTKSKLIKVAKDVVNMPEMQNIKTFLKGKTR